MAALAAMTGAWAVGGDPSGVSLALVAASAFSGVAGANALNDVVDAAVDAKAHPDRPIPRGWVSPRAARRVANGALALGLVAGTLASVWAGTLAILLVGLLLGYESSWKR